MLSPSCGTLKDADVSGLDYVESDARFTFSEYYFTSSKAARDRALRQE